MKMNDFPGPLAGILGGVFVRAAILFCLWLGVSLRAEPQLWITNNATPASVNDNIKTAFDKVNTNFQGLFGLRNQFTYTNQTTGQVLTWDGTGWTNSTASGGGGSGDVSYTAFNTNQFSTNGGTVSIKSGALQTNGTFSGTLTLNGSPVLTNAASGGITNSGMTLNTIQKATGTNGIGDSDIVDDGNDVTFNSQRVSPLMDESTDLGNTTNGWRTLYVKNANIKTVLSAFNGVFTNTLTLGGVSVVNGVGTINKIPLFSAASTIADSPFAASGTNVSLSGNLTANGGAFTNLLTLNGVTVLTNVPSGTASASGTANTHAKFTSTTNLGNSLITDDGTNVYQTGTGAFQLPMGTTAERPASLTNGMIRYNTTTARTEFYNGSAWNNHVRLAGDAMTGPLTNTASAISDVPFVAKGASGQTNDLQQWYSNTVSVARMTPAGNLLLGSKITLPNGTAAAPALVFNSGAADSFGIYYSSGIILSSGGTPYFHFGSGGNINKMGSTGLLAWGSGDATTSGDTFLSRESAAVIQLGTDVAAPVNQTLKSADGVGTDKAGANFTIEGGQGTGTGAGGTLFFATSKARTTASTANPYTNWMSIDSNGAVAISNITGTATLLTGLTSSNTLAGVGIGSGLAMSGTNLVTTTTATNIVTLTMTGTNVSAMDFSLVKSGGAFKLVLTGNAYVGSPVNVTTADFKKATFFVQQPSTGTCIIQFTNAGAGWAWPEGVSPVIDTNGGAVSYFDFRTDVFTNGLVHGTLVPLSKVATNM
jgi:hypothetical protein